MKEGFIPISKMAKLHHLSRQTLIHYDKIGLFKPILVDDNAYRYYSAGQIPILKEICTMKEYGLSLDEIKQIISSSNNEDTQVALLKKQKENLEKIQQLKLINYQINRRLLFYQQLDKAKRTLNQPFIIHRKRSHVFVHDFQIYKGFCYEKLIEEFTKLWEEFEQVQLFSCESFGLMFKREIFDGCVQGKIFVELHEGSGNYVIEEGEYACVYRSGLIEDGKELEGLKRFIDEAGYVMDSDVLDTCILDRTMDMNESGLGLCLTQVKIKRV